VEIGSRLESPGMERRESNLSWHRVRGVGDQIGGDGDRVERDCDVLR